MATLGDKLAARDQRNESGEASQNGAASAVNDDWIWTPCYSARKSSGGMLRLDFRGPEGLCISLPYSALIDIQFGRESDPPYEWITFDYTHYWHILLVGSNLEPLYSRLQTHSVAWVRKGDKSEKVVDQPFIDAIKHQKMTDPKVAFAALQHQQRTLLGENN